LITNIVITTLRYKIHGLTTAKKIAQSIIIWGITIIGAAIIYIFIKEDKKIYPAKNSSSTGSNYGADGVQPPD